MSHPFKAFCIIVWSIMLRLNSSSSRDPEKEIKIIIFLFIVWTSCALNCHPMCSWWTLVYISEISGDLKKKKKKTWKPHLNASQVSWTWSGLPLKTPKPSGQHIRSLTDFTSRSTTTRWMSSLKTSCLWTGKKKKEMACAWQNLQMI